MVKWITIWGVVAVTTALLAGIIAYNKRLDHSFWAGWSFIFPPMLLVLLVMPRNTGPRIRRPTLDEQDAARGD